jgi:hypothetical protein
MSAPQHEEVYSARVVRGSLLVIALCFAAAAIFLVDGWLVWLLAACGFIFGCAGITPPFRRPN